MSFVSERCYWVKSCSVSDERVKDGSKNVPMQALISQEIIPDLAWQNLHGNVLGIYLHGLFEDPAVIKSLFGKEAKTLEVVFNNLADLIGRHIPKETLLSLIK